MRKPQLFALTIAVLSFGICADHACAAPANFSDSAWIDLARREGNRLHAGIIPQDWIATVDNQHDRVVVTFRASAPRPGMRLIGHGNTWVVIEKRTRQIIDVKADQ